MVLTTHSVVGASVAKIAGINPLAGFVCGLLSHYFIDSITHWDYKLKSSNEADDPAERVLTIGKNFYFDLLKIGLDLALGIFLVFLFFGKTVDPYILLSGIFGGILPDFLQFLFFKFKKQPLIFMQKIHDFVHAKKKMKDRPVLGISLQIIIIAIFILAGRLL